ncbi:MAG TPA: hypothetical protein ENK04_07755 [Gammaproteobacteria bacterium]|nr:hypothetical protein [Gammaproteobacteria bacterium]
MRWLIICWQTNKKLWCRFRDSTPDYFASTKHSLIWQVGLMAMLDEHAQKQGKVIRQVDEFHCFSGFYRVCVFELDGP